MSDDSQLQVPPAFVALYVPPGRIRPTLAAMELFERHELCEDLSVLLVERARALIFELGIAEADVLGRVHTGLLGGESPVTEAEAGWVVGRLAEHLGWESVRDSLPFLPRPAQGRRGDR